MISITKTDSVKTTEENYYITAELRGLSTDTKPTTIGDKTIDNGSVFIEMDTGKIYFYNLDSQTWVEFGGSDDNGR